MEVFSKIYFWLKAARLYTLSQSVVPYLFAAALAAINYEFTPWLSFLGLIGVALAHLSVNLWDDYFDWKKGTVAEYKKLLEKGIHARTHKCYYLDNGSATIKQTMYAALTMDFIACLLGLIIFLNIGWVVVFIALIAGILGFFYSAPPLNWSYRGLGEIVIGIIFGPLLMLGAYYTSGGKLDEQIILSSLIIGIIVSNMAYVGALMDYDSDLKANKKSLPIRIGTKKTATRFLLYLYLAAYALVIFGVISYIFPPLSLIVFITLPKVIALVKLMDIEKSEPKWWMGLMENWGNFKKEGADWFMMRLFLSRNIVTDFVILLVLSLCYNSLQ